MAINVLFSDAWKVKGETEEMAIGGASIQVFKDGAYPADQLHFSGKGMVLLTPLRLVFVHSIARSRMQSFCLPLMNIKSIQLARPWIWGDSVIKGTFEPIKRLGLSQEMSFELNCGKFADTLFEKICLVSAECGQCMREGGGAMEQILASSNTDYYIDSYLKHYKKEVRTSPPPIAFYKSSNPLLLFIQRY